MSVRGTLVLTPSTVVFPARSVGVRLEQSVTASNIGRAPLTLRWSSLEEPFSAEGLPAQLAPGAHTFTVHFLAPAPGRFDATLEATDEDGVSVTLTLQAEARDVPICPDPGTCRTVRYDMDTEKCITDTHPDDTPCTGETKCLLDAVCRVGTCVGQPRSCDDGNACTLDTCNPLVGCESFPRPPCEGGGPCERGVCDPQLGCVYPPVSDGTLCRGGRTACDVADVCISGQCMEADPPDGFLCAEASPCQGEGRCLASVCQRAPATPIALDFTFDARPLEDDPTAPTLHDFWMDEVGEMSLAGWPNGVPVLSVTSATPVDAAGEARRCLLWDGRPICADFPGKDAEGRAEAGMVSLLDTTTGTARWTFQLRQSRPDLAAPFSSSPTLLFVTRIGAMGSDRLMVLFEGYPRDVGAQEQGRRRYLLVVLDAQGRLVGATPLSDPLLDRSDHPHPFGVAADSLG
ncbi:MAG: tenascin-X, partial [Myxococcaceae bacterium]|nr:tenascin-X [Myxococcaceae bacterium]